MNFLLPPLLQWHTWQNHRNNVQAIIASHKNNQVFSDSNRRRCAFLSPSNLYTAVLRKAVLSDIFVLTALLVGYDSGGPFLSPGWNSFHVNCYSEIHIFSTFTKVKSPTWRQNLVFLKITSNADRTFFLSTAVYLSRVHSAHSRLMVRHPRRCTILSPWWEGICLHWIVVRHLSSP